MNDSALKIFSGLSNNALALEIASYLDMELSGIELKRFKDGEISVKIKDNVRAHDVFIIQSTCNPSNDHIMELLFIIDAAVRASALRITAVIPYFGYARQDRKVEPRVPISAKVVSNIIQVTGADRVLTMDLHADQIQGFFDIPVDNLYATPIAIQYLTKLNIENVVVVSPDTGGVDRARFLAKKLDTSLAIIDKRRADANISDVMNVIGEVAGKNCILVDDIADTAGSISKAAIALKERGAKDIYCFFSHPVLSDNAVENLRMAEFKQIIFTNSIPLPEEKKLKNMQVLSIAPLFGEAIRRIHNGESVSSLFL
ncbi:MAG: ribose-phosphate pyrophosphokinase [Leptospirales bacterium]|nr:ribose-phosphate pyrophosphokinase [Leptospirales bacterium]